MGSTTCPTTGSITRKSASVHNSIDQPGSTAAASANGKAAAIKAPMYGTKRSTPARMPHSTALGTADQPQPEPDRDAEGGVHDELDEKQPTKAASGIVERRGRAL